MSNQINLHEPLFDKEDEELVLESIKSSWVSSGGPFVNEFENKFSEFVGVKHAISVCNGTVGLQLTLEVLKRILNINEKFDVLVPSLTFIATANSIVHAGGTPIFIDVQKNSFQICPNSLKETILNNYTYSVSEKKWKNKISKHSLLAIMPVHIMGWFYPVEEIQNISNEFNVTVIEDAAEALGTFSLRQEHIGKSGLASVFSFNGNKILTTGGGGMIVTDDDNFANRLKHLSTTAKSDGLHFIHDEVGYNYRLVNVLAALGCSQLKKLHKKLEQKKRIFNQYKELFSQNNLYLYEQNNCVSNNWLNNLILPNLEMRNNALNSLIQNNVQARPLWMPCHKQPAYKYLKNNVYLPNTDEMWEKTLSLPSSPQLKTEQIQFISNIIIESMNSV